MFHLVQLQSMDSAKKLAAIGLKLKRKNKKDYIQQPCPAYRESQCSIYELRPERCRLFECRQLQKVASGEITEVMAAEKIQEAQQRVAQVEELFARLGETNRKRPFTKRHEKIEAEPPDETSVEAVELRAQLTAAMQELEQLLENDFRVK